MDALCLGGRGDNKRNRDTMSKELILYMFVLVLDISDIVKMSEQLHHQNMPRRNRNQIWRTRQNLVIHAYGCMNIHVYPWNPWCSARRVVSR